MIEAKTELMKLNGEVDISLPDPCKVVGLIRAQIDSLEARDAKATK